MIRHAIPLWFAVLALWPTAAFAQAPDEATMAEARRLFEEAEAEFAGRRFQSAADLYQRSYDLLGGHRNQYLVLFNRAQALAQAGQYDAAIGTFRRYMTEGGERVQNRGEIDARIAEIEALRGPEEAAAPSAASNGPDEGLLIGSITGFGLAVLGLAGMGTFGGLALAEHDALAAGCGATRSCTESDVATSDSFALVADVSLGIAAVALTTGVVLLIVALAGSGGTSERALRRTSSTYALGAEGVVSW